MAKTTQEQKEQPAPKSQNQQTDTFFQLVPAKLKSERKQVKNFYCDDLVVDENFFAQETNLDNFFFRTLLLSEKTADLIFTRV